MPVDPAKVTAAPRTVEIDGIGPVVVRRPVLADVQNAAANPYWWAKCCSMPDGSPLFAAGADIGQLDAEVAAALITEVNRPRPTPGQNDALGASEAPSNG
jgi:hypothetical protein